MTMSIATTVILGVIVVILVLAIITVWMERQRAHSQKLQSRFGPEYERALEAAGSRHAAEQDLAARQRRVEGFNIRDLTPNDRQQFSARWREAQILFVDEPAQAIAEADRLVNEVMQARGYPVADFEQRAADLSVDHAEVVSNYRAARLLVARNEQRLASTEDLRQAMVHFRALFDDLLGASEERKEQVAV